MFASASKKCTSTNCVINCAVRKKEWDDTCRSGSETISKQPDGIGNFDKNFPPPAWKVRTTASPSDMSPSNTTQTLKGRANQFSKGCSDEAIAADLDRAADAPTKKTNSALCSRNCSSPCSTTGQDAQKSPTAKRLKNCSDCWFPTYADVTRESPLNRRKGGGSGSKSKSGPGVLGSGSVLVKHESEQNEQHCADHSTIHKMQQRAPPESTPVTSATTRGKHVAVAVHFSKKKKPNDSKVVENEMICNSDQADDSGTCSARTLLPPSARASQEKTLVAGKGLSAETRERLDNISVVTTAPAAVLTSAPARVEIDSMLSDQNESKKDRMKVVTRECPVLATQGPLNSFPASRPHQRDVNNEANAAELTFLFSLLLLHVVLPTLTCTLRHGSPNDKEEASTHDDDAREKEKREAAEESTAEQQDVPLNQKKDVTDQGVETLARFVPVPPIAVTPLVTNTTKETKISRPRPRIVAAEDGDTNTNNLCSFVGRRRGVPTLLSRAWSCTFLLLFTCFMFCGFHSLSTPTGTFPAANSTSTLACVIGASVDSCAIVAAATIEESALETSGTWRDAAAAPARTRPSAGDVEIDVRVIGADSLEVGVAAGMENLLENENRSIDDPYYSSTTSRSGSYNKMVQSVRNERRESSACENSRHVAAGIEVDAFLTSCLHAAKEEFLGSNDDASSRRKRFKGRMVSIFFFFFFFCEILFLLFHEFGQTWK